MKRTPDDQGVARPTPWEELRALTRAVLDAENNPGPDGTAQQLARVIPLISDAIAKFDVLMEAVEWNVREFALRALKLIEGEEEPKQESRWR